MKAVITGSEGFAGKYLVAELQSHGYQVVGLDLVESDITRKVDLRDAEATRRMIEEEKPDFVFAGINTGYNISHDIQYSATLGAVMEARLWDIPAIAFSQGNVIYQDVVDRYLIETMEECMNRPLDPGQVWNIHFPCCELADCKGIQWDVRVSDDKYYVDSYKDHESSDGARVFRLAAGRIWKGTEGTDLAAVVENYVAVGKVRNIG